MSASYEYWWQRDRRVAMAWCAFLERTGELLDAEAETLVEALEQMTEALANVDAQMPGAYREALTAIERAERLHVIRETWLRDSEVCFLLDQPLPPIPPELLKDPNR